MITFIKSTIASLGKSGVYCAPLGEISKNEAMFNLFLESVERTPDWKGVEEGDDAAFYPVVGTEKIGGEEYDKYAEEPVCGPFVWVSTQFVTTIRARGIIKNGAQGEYFSLSELKSRSEQLASRKALSKPTTEKKVVPKTISPEDAAF